MKRTKSDLIEVAGAIVILAISVAAIAISYYFLKDAAVECLLQAPFLR